MGRDGVGGRLLRRPSDTVHGQRSTGRETCPGRVAGQIAGPEVAPDGPQGRSVTVVGASELGLPYVAVVVVGPLHVAAGVGEEFEPLDVPPFGVGGRSPSGVNGRRRGTRGRLARKGPRSACGNGRIV